MSPETFDAFSKWSAMRAEVVKTARALTEGKADIAELSALLSAETAARNAFHNATKEG